MIRCERCSHANEPGSNFCSSCGAPLGGRDDDDTVTLGAVRAEEQEEDLAQYLEGLPAGLGLLVVRYGPTRGSSYRLDAPVVTAGRHPDSDIFFDDITVSRRHVRFERRGDDYVLHDVGSLNGTYLNRRRVDEAVLHHGDEIQIGRFRLTFVQGGHERSE